jgi:type II secretory pathway pseudopilin PulG
MKRNTLYSHHSTVAADRLGVTMVEVLMSLMIMSIGIASVAVLFPIAVLRSIQATQLTNAAILKSNAETLIDSRKQLIFDPDGDGNIREHVGRREELNYIVDPRGYCDIASSVFDAPFASFAVNATLDAMNDGSTANDSTLRGGADWVGNTDTDSTGFGEPYPVLPRYDGGTRVSTFPFKAGGYVPFGGTSDEARALRMVATRLCRLGDGWETVLDVIPDQFILTGGAPSANAFINDRIIGLVLPADADLSDVPSTVSVTPAVAGMYDMEVTRAVVFSADGQFSVALPLLECNNGSKQILWSETSVDLNGNGVFDERVLPPEFVTTVAPFPFVIGRVVLQTMRVNDYSWLLTVRRGRDGQARGVDVVITHNSGVTPDDERLYTASFDSRTTSVNSPFQIEVFKDGGKFADQTDAVPALRRGGYVLDIDNARWYRIAQYREQAVTIYDLSLGPVTKQGYVISLESAVVANSPTTAADVDPNPLVVDPRFAGKAMFVPGVIDVYPMGSVTIPENL